MANHKGREGLVKFGSNQIGELRGWEINETNEPIEDTTLSDTARTFQPGLNSFTGSATAFWDETDTAQDALTIGATGTINVHPEGTGSGADYYTGSIIVQEIGRRAAIQGIVEVDFSFRGTGALTNTTVT